MELEKNNVTTFEQEKSLTTQEQYEIDKNGLNILKLKTNKIYITITKADWLWLKILLNKTLLNF